MAVLRGERPEVTERVAEAGAAIATALRSVLDAAATQRDRGTSSPSPHPAVQRIDLGTGGRESRVSLAIGVDIGGTKVAAGVVDEAGRVDRPRAARHPRLGRRARSRR